MEFRSFASAARSQNNKQKTLTDNGMVARVTTASALVDLFNCIGSSRGSDITKSFYAALAADEDKAVRILLWARDILSGAGEREQFRKLLKKLEEYDHKLAGKLIPKIPELGRWDDLFYFSNLENRSKAFDYYQNALKEGNALAAKWAPRERSAKRALAYEFRKHMGIKPKEYRKLLVNNTEVVENKMCSNSWSDIDFSHVPSVASLIYQTAFQKHVPEKYQTYLNALETGDLVDGKAVKVNAGAVYPHDIVISVLRGHTSVAYAQWESLPNYTNGTRILPLVDVSGSMGTLTWTSELRPIHTAVALGLYLSEKNTSVFKDVFMTFTSQPKFETLSGDLRLKLGQMNSADWGNSTNVEAAFQEILNLAVSNKLSADDMPEMLLILSDMEFDQACKPNLTAMKMIKDMFKNAGYTVPKVVFWNLSTDTQHAPVKFTKNGVATVSGFSPSIMKSILSSDLEKFTPESVMLETIMSERYDY